MTTIFRTKITVGVHVNTSPTDLLVERDTASDQAAKVLKGEGVRPTTKLGHNQHTKGRPSSEKGPPITIAEAAARNGLSERSQKRLEAVQRNGIPELAQAVIDKQIKVTTAERFTHLPEDQQREQLALHIEAAGKRARDPDKVTAKQLSSMLHERYLTFIHPKFQEILDKQPPDYVVVGLRNIDAALQRLLDPI